MKKRNILLNIVMFSGISLLITMAVYFANTWFFSSGEYFSPTDVFFIEGILFLISGVLLLLGRGGINLWGQKAAILSASAGAVYGGDTVGPAETLRRVEARRVRAYSFDFDIGRCVHDSDIFSNSVILD